MKYYFFINPIAGQGKHKDKLVDEIERYMSRKGADYRIIITEEKGDGVIKSREIAESLNGEEARFYAAGGDGTLNEIVNGMYGYDNIAVGSIPVGTGNDTIRNFTGVGDFSSIEAQVEGDEKRIDLIRYKGVIDGEKKTECCVNMINIGFDCSVVIKTNNLKKKPLVAGSFAYLLAVFATFIEKKGISLRITEIGSDKLTSTKVIRNGHMLLCAVCNGSYCGGGIQTAPLSRVDDGEFELNIFSDVTRGEFLKWFPKFKSGTHMDAHGIDEVVDLVKSKDAYLEPYDTFDFPMCVDGEIKTTTGIRVTIQENALRFILPKRRGD